MINRSCCIRVKIIVRVVAAFLAATTCLYSKPACITNDSIWLALSCIGNIKSDADKVKRLEELLDRFYTCHNKPDSVYIRLLDRMAKFQFAIGNTDKAIAYGESAVNAIHLLQKSQSSGYVNFVAYFNLAYYKEETRQYNASLRYLDTAITVARMAGKFYEDLLDARLSKERILFYLGDYQKIIEEASAGLLDCDRFNIEPVKAYFYNYRAQGNIYQQDIRNAYLDASLAYALSKKYGLGFELASALKTLAIIEGKKLNDKQADSLFKACISERSKGTTINDTRQVADDYIDYGNYLLAGKKYSEQLKAQKNALAYAQKISDRKLLAKAFTAIGVAYFNMGNIEACGINYFKAFASLGLLSRKNTIGNITASDLNGIFNKDLVIALLGNETELYIKLYRKVKERQYLDTSVYLALVTDSVISFSRHEQYGELSKLYWRDKTREFYTNAIEACYLAGNKTLAYYFMERSRAVLLNDHLNELGAGNQLSDQDMLKQQALQLDVVRKQQALTDLSPGDTAYSNRQLAFINAKDTLEHFIRSLEDRYPAYYQYKYADSPPSLRDLQLYLGKKDQQFLQYFFTDTVTYCLSIHASGADFFKIDSSKLSAAKIFRFNQLCSNYDILNSNYKEFISLSGMIYTALFEHIETTAKRLIVCSDNITIPFEALITDADHYLLEKFSVSYVYSGTVLLKKAKLDTPVNNFIGFAPATFSSALLVPDLPGSEAAIKKAASFYTTEDLFTGKSANRKNFIANLSGGAIVSFYSHAVSDSNGKGPAIFLYDSLIRMSELELIKNQATQLVILSACETNVGKNYSGEGIFSIARGFSSIGIPAVAATLWKADENTIYEISALFNKQLASGAEKDKALQSAKLQFLENHSGEKRLPCYWASLILVGDTNAVLLSKKRDNYFFPMLSAAIIVLSAILIFYLARKKGKAGPASIKVAG